jgi:gamma-glutamyltranspeptidase
MPILQPEPLPPRKAVVKSPYGVVAAQSRLAAAVGTGILAAGGNAVDAAVAAGLDERPRRRRLHGGGEGRRFAA